MKYIVLIMVAVVLEMVCCCKEEGTSSFSCLHRILRSKFSSAYSASLVVNHTRRSSCKVVKALVANRYPFLYFSENYKTSGYMGELWYALEKFVCLKPTYIENGEKKPILAGEADLSLVPAVMKSSMYNKYDATVSISTTGYHFYTNAIVHNRNIYLTVMNRGIYACLLVTTLCFVLVQRIKLEFSASLYPEKYWDVSFFSSFLNVLGLVFQRGSEMKEKCWTGRVMSLVCSTFGLLLTTYYSAMLVAKIAASNENPVTVTSFSDVVYLRRTTRAVCLAERTSVFQALTKSKPLKDVELLAKWKNFINRPPCSRTLKEDVEPEDYCQDRSVVLGEFHSTHRLLARGAIGCNLLWDTTPFFKAHLTILLKKGFKHRELLNQFLIRMQSSGIMARLKDIWFPRYVSRVRSTGYKEYSLSFWHMQQIMFCYIAVVCLMPVLLILEIIVFKFNNTLKFKTKQCFNSA